jgi:hypothetical protein
VAQYVLTGECSMKQIGESAARLIAASAAQPALVDLPDGTPEHAALVRRENHKGATIDARPQPEAKLGYRPPRSSKPAKGTKTEVA